MSKAVAVAGDTQFETSTAKLPADAGQSGSWEAVGKLDVTPGKTISVNGKKVELSAEMTWAYVGGTAANGSQMPPVFDTATLKASETKLTDFNEYVLVEGDEEVTTHGNRIFVEKSQDILKTA